MLPLDQHPTALEQGQHRQVAGGQSHLARKLAIVSIITAVCALIVYASNPGPTTLTATCSSIATPVQLGSGLVHAHTFVFEGFKGNRTTNTGVVWIQTTSANDSPGVPLYPGERISFNSQRPYDDSDFWIDAENANDGVVVLVQDRP